MIDPRRSGRYERIYAQLHELVAKSPSLTAAMATICAVLHHKMPHHLWTGFYLTSPVAGAGQRLHVGPYQGLVACQVLEDGGVCLHSVATRQPVVVADVHAFPGHVACDERSQSEIVIPLLKGERVMGVLDVDSDRLTQFDDDDIAPLQRIVSLLDPFL